ncbi:hypothetical protein ABZ826_26155 [Streptomyces sp. NPDC047515]|uniref:hypothetical protein n=1 Tax=Streptomyces sp. NPDC047515 TaxID=3155380 RepID=UPI0033EFDE7B
MTGATGSTAGAACQAARARGAARIVLAAKDLDDLSRLYGGATDLYLRPVDPNDALTASLDDLGPGGHTIDDLRCPT